jgi:histidine ammonia-lyase
MITIGQQPLTIDEIIQVARIKEAVKLGDNAIALVMESNLRLKKIIDSDRPVYGINTGFGIFADKRIQKNEIKKLNRNLILSHAVGVGEPLSDEIVRAAMIVRANTLAKGYSGVRLELINTIIEALNHQVTPIIPSQGSLGSSGDLCPLSHMALVLTTDESDLEAESGYAKFNKSKYSGQKAMQLAGIPRCMLGPKEGLALNNGATFSAAITAIAIHEANYLAEIADKAISLSLEALRGSPDAFDSRIHEARGLAGQLTSANNIKTYTEGSTLIGSTNKVQDAYSLRCAPQVHGAIRDTIDFAKSIIGREINAATDNPLIFEPDIALSGGNFHGEPVALVADYLGIALSELGAISERRTYRLTDGKLNDGLPAMLVDSSQDEGLKSGVMILQYTAASLVLENQTLASPDSVHSLPTSGGQEDHNANAMNAAKHTLQIIDNIRIILSIELFVATRAIELRMRSNNKLGRINQQTYDKIRSQIPFSPEDKIWSKDINKLTKMLREQQI